MLPALLDRPPHFCDMMYINFPARCEVLMTGTLEDHIAHMYAMRLGLNVENPPVYIPAAELRAGRGDSQRCTPSA
jgi:hypothetical protein